MKNSCAVHPMFCLGRGQKANDYYGRNEFGATSEKIVTERGATQITM